MRTTVELDHRAAQLIQAAMNADPELAALPYEAAVTVLIVLGTKSLAADLYRRAAALMAEQAGNTGRIRLQDARDLYHLVATVMRRPTPVKEERGIPEPGGRGYARP